MSYQKIIRYFCKIAKAYEKYQEIQDACASYTNALKILEVAPVAIATQLRETEICKFAHRERERLTRQQHQPAALRFSGIAGTAATSTSVSRRQATDSSAAAGASHPTASAPTTEEKKNVNRKILKEKAKAK